MYLLQKSFINNTLNFLFPPNCPLCHEMLEASDGLCKNCWRTIHFLAKPQCRLCGYPFETEPALAGIEGDSLLCGHCLVSPKTYDQARAAFAYDEVSKGLILPFKHTDRLDLAPLLSNWLYAAATDFLDQVDIICPVPLYKWRLLRRKYNQAALLGTHLAKKINLPHYPDLLRRMRSTPNQGHLSYAQRYKNMQNAFKLQEKYLTLVKDKSILLIDDVYTSGATISACALALRTSGANKIYVLTLARVLRASPIK